MNNLLFFYGNSLVMGYFLYQHCYKCSIGYEIKNVQDGRIKLGIAFAIARLLRKILSIFSHLMCGNL